MGFKNKKNPRKQKTTSKQKTHKTNLKHVYLLSHQFSSAFGGFVQTSHCYLLKLLGEHAHILKL